MKDGATLDNIEFNRGTVMRAIKRLKNNTASGPDGMPPIMYKNLAQSLAEPLALIFESFMSVGAFQTTGDALLYLRYARAASLQMFQTIAQLH